MANQGLRLDHTRTERRRGVLFDGLEVEKQISHKQVLEGEGRGHCWCKAVFDGKRWRQGDHQGEGQDLVEGKSNKSFEGGSDVDLGLVDVIDTCHFEPVGQNSRCSFAVEPKLLLFFSKHI